MKAKFKYLFSLLILLSLSLQAQRGIKIGYIDMDYIFENIPQFQQSMNQLDMKAQKWKSEIAKKQEKINNLKEELENERPLLTVELIEEKEEEIEYLQEKLFEYQDEKFGVGGDFMVQKRQLIIPIQDQVFNAVQELGDERGYDFIFENSVDTQMLYSARRHDLSDIVLKMIKRSIKTSDEDLFEDDYKSVEQAKEDKEKESQRKADREAKEQERDQIIEQRRQERDSIRAARKKEFEERRRKIMDERKARKRQRDSIQKARENN
ncbi:MAG: OmpH family outer membrane protein [Bacteroidota bacterium]